MTLWLELTCDCCGRKMDGQTIRTFSEADRKKLYMKVSAAGWLAGDSKHLCPICFHREVSGHRISASDPIRCLEPGCRLNKT